MNILKFTLFILILSAFTVTQSSAQTYDAGLGCVIDANGQCIANTLLSATPFLTIVPDARSGAMGDAGVAISPDANSLHFNASKLAFVDQDVELSGTYTPWLRNLGLSDVYLAYIGGYKRIDELSTFGGALRFFSLGDIAFTDINGQATGTGKPRELELSVAYARKLSDKLSTGLGMKFINSNLAAGQVVDGVSISAANAFAADISFTYSSNGFDRNTDGNFSAGVAITNLGTKVSYTSNSTQEFLPANLGIGLAYQKNIDDYNSITFAIDFDKLLVPTPIPFGHEDYDVSPANGIADYREKSTFSGLFGSFNDAPGGFSEELNEFSVSLGVEYWYINQFAVRAGYFYEHPLKGDRKYITFGVGIKYNVFGIDISYLAPTNTQRSPLDNTLRFTFKFNLGGEPAGIN